MFHCHNNYGTYIQVIDILYQTMKNVAKYILFDTTIILNIMHSTAGRDPYHHYASMSID